MRRGVTPPPFDQHAAARQGMGEGWKYPYKIQSPSSSSGT